MHRLILTLLLTITMMTPALSKTHISGGGRKPPKSLNDSQLAVAEQVIRYLSEVHPEENTLNILALIMVETNLKEGLRSHTGDYGLMQVNCSIWSKKLKKRLGITNCRKQMHDLKLNIDAGIMIFNAFKKYRSCKSYNIFACYNGGMGWRLVMKRCEKECVGKCRKCSRPARYMSSVKKHIRFLRTKYSHLFDL